ncbi:MAG: hypothetical protein ACO3F2_02155 [Roseiflexaceae bacterium]|jgi:hypothetical protein
MQDRGILHAYIPTLRRFWPLAIAIVVMWSLISVYGMPSRWTLDVADPNAAIYMRDIRQAENVVINGQSETIRWTWTSSSYLFLPNPTQHQIGKFVLPWRWPDSIVAIRTMARSEEPPNRIQMTVGAAFDVDLPNVAGVRVHHLLVPAVDALRFDCDNSATTDPDLAAICIAIMRVDANQVRQPVNIPMLLWNGTFIIFCLAITRYVFGILSEILPIFGFVVLTTISMMWPVQTSTYAWELLIGGGVAILSFAVLRRSTLPIWLRIALMGMFANIILKEMGVLAPGIYAIDIKFHANRFNEALWYSIYQYAEGRGTNYPYPPIIYLLMAPVVLPAEQLFGIHDVIHTVSVIIESSTIVVLAWLMQRLRWTPLQIALMSALYVVLPAGFQLQWYATIAQSIGQWLGVLAIALSVIGINRWSVLAMYGATLGHFGAFLTVHLSMTLAMLSRQLRRIGLWWWGVVALVGMLYYSQFITLILAQLGRLKNTLEPTTFEQRLYDYIWEYGFVGHYNGIFVGLMVIGLIIGQRTQWWRMALAMVAAASILLCAQLFFDIVPTRYIIYLFPVIATYAALPLSRLWRSRSGRMSVVVLLCWVLWQSLYVWIDGVTQGTLIGVLY